MPSQYIHTEVIILKRTNYKEADKILTVYTKPIGKTIALAKGIRKVNSRKSGHLELLNHSKVHLVKGKHWFIVTQAETINCFSNIKRNFEITQWGYYIVEIFDKLIPAGENNEMLFRFLLKTIEILNDTINFNIVNAFNLKLIKLTGFYEKKSLTIQNKHLIDYLYDLEINAYKTISSARYNTKITSIAHQFLREYTEKVLDTKIRTVLPYQN